MAATIVSTRLRNSDVPSDLDGQILLKRAMQIAGAVPYDPSATRDEQRAAYCQNLGNAFKHLVALWAHDAGVVDADVDVARWWLRDAGAPLAGVSVIRRCM